MASHKNVKVKVKVADLIKAIEKKEVAEKKRYERAKAQHDKEAGEWAKKAEKVLRKAITDIGKQGLDYEPNGSGGYRVNEVLLPRRPSQPGEPTCFDGVLNLLRMSADESLSMTVEQYEAYMRGCRI